MPDYGLSAAVDLSAADRAVKYLLDRIQFDRDLFWICGPSTESFRLLVQAESARTGEDEEAIYQRRRQVLTPKHHDQEPQVVRLRRELDALREKLELFD